MQNLVEIKTKKASNAIKVYFAVNIREQEIPPILMNHWFLRQPLSVYYLINKHVVTRPYNPRNDFDLGQQTRMLKNREEDLHGVQRLKNVSYNLPQLASQLKKFIQGHDCPYLDNLIQQSSYFKVFFQRREELSTRPYDASLSFMPLKHPKTRGYGVQRYKRGGAAYECELPFFCVYPQPRNRSKAIRSVFRCAFEFFRAIDNLLIDYVKMMNEERELMQGSHYKMKCKMCATLDHYLSFIFSQTYAEPNIVSICQTLLEKNKIQQARLQQKILMFLRSIWNPVPGYPIALYKDFFEMLDEIIIEVDLRDKFLDRDQHHATLIAYQRSINKQCVKASVVKFFFDGVVEDWQIQDYGRKKKESYQQAHRTMIRNFIIEYDLSPQKVEVKNVVRELTNKLNKKVQKTTALGVITNTMMNEQIAGVNSQMGKELLRVIRFAQENKQILKEKTYKELFLEELLTVEEQYCLPRTLKDLELLYLIAPKARDPLTECDRKILFSFKFL